MFVFAEAVVIHIIALIFHWIVGDWKICHILFFVLIFSIKFSFLLKLLFLLFYLLFLNNILLLKILLKTLIQIIHFLLWVFKWVLSYKLFLLIAKLLIFILLAQQMIFLVFYFQCPKRFQIEDFILQAIYLSLEHLNFLILIINKTFLLLKDLL